MFINTINISYLVDILLLLFLLYYRIVKTNINKFFYEISNIKLNFTKINLETKSIPPYNDCDLIMPRIIEYGVKRKSNTLTYPKIVIAVLSSPHNFKKRCSFRKNRQDSCNEKVDRNI